jgi:hypothetical protein
MKNISKRLYDTNIISLGSLGMDSVLPENPVFLWIFSFEIHTHSMTRTNPIFLVKLNGFGRMNLSNPYTLLELTKCL